MKLKRAINFTWTKVLCLTMVVLFYSTTAHAANKERGEGIFGWFSSKKASKYPEPFHKEKDFISPQRLEELKQKQQLNPDDLTEAEKRALLKHFPPPSAYIAEQKNQSAKDKLYQWQVRQFDYFKESEYLDVDRDTKGPEEFIAEHKNKSKNDQLLDWQVKEFKLMQDLADYDIPEDFAAPKEMVKPQEKQPQHNHLYDWQMKDFYLHQDHAGQPILNQHNQK